MNRRAVLSGLAVGPLGAFAGCMSGECPFGTIVTFEPVDAETIATDWTDNDEARVHPMLIELTDRTIAGEEPTVETLEGRPLEWVTYVERDGDFYEFAEETVAEGQVFGPEYVLSRDREMDAEVLSDDAIAFADLPRHDQWRVNEMADYDIPADGMPTYYSEVPFVAGYLDEADQEASILAAGIDASAIEAGGDVARIEHLGEGSADARRYRYTATRIADDIDAFADYVLDRHGSTAFDPSDEVRRLLSETQAEGGQLRICERGRGDVDEETAERRRAALDELRREVFSLTPPVAPEDDTSSSGPHVPYVQYEGQWYRIDFYTFDEGGGG